MEIREIRVLLVRRVREMKKEMNRDEEGVYINWVY
jgi:hypothetical protein